MSLHKQRHIYLQKEGERATAFAFKRYLHALHALPILGSANLRTSFSGAWARTAVGTGAQICLCIAELANPAQYISRYYLIKLPGNSHPFPHLH